MQLQSLLQSTARLSTKLAAALLEAGWSWSQIEADAGLSDRTIRRAKREIDLGPPAQVGQKPAQVGQPPAQVGHVPAQVGQNGPGGPGSNARADLLSLSYPSGITTDQREIFEADTTDLDTPPIDLMARSQWLWERISDRPYEYAVIQRHSSRYGLNQVVEVLQRTWDQDKKLESPAAWLGKCLSNNSSKATVQKPAEKPVSKYAALMEAASK